MVDILQTHGDARVLPRALVRCNEECWGHVFGVLSGFGLCVATNFPIQQDGRSVEQHQAALMPGHRVTPLAGVIGFVYPFVLGCGIVRTVGAAHKRPITAK